MKESRKVGRAFLDLTQSKPAGFTILVQTVFLYLELASHSYLNEPILTIDPVLVHDPPALLAPCDGAMPRVIIDATKTAIAFFLLNICLLCSIRKV